MSRFERLFSPIQVGAVELRNRIIMPGMEAALTNEDGSMSERAIRFYEKVGFRKEGVQRDGYYCDHQYHDFVMMSILDDELRRPQAPEGG